MYDLIIKNGTAVLPSGVADVDIGVQAGKIAAVGNLSAEAAREIVDASGKLVMPGMIDPHVHLADSETDIYKDAYAVDDFYTGTRAAAYGGNTTVIDFAPAAPSHSAIDTVKSRCQQTENQTAVDFSHHAIIGEDTELSLTTIAQLPAQGTNSIKVFMFRERMADDFAFLRVMETAARGNLLVMVHAENGAMLTGYQNALVQAGQTAVAHFPNSQPAILEIEAAQRAILLAEKTGVALYIVHISCATTVELVRQARARGLNVIGETVPHYLLLTEAVYHEPNGADFLCGPPIRTAADSQALWQGLADGTLSTIGSDHCGFTSAQKAWGKDDFRRGPKGMASIETRVAVIYSKGVVKGRISLPRFVEVLSTNPARVFGLYPRKGVIAPGSDADFCVLDPRLEWTVTPQTMHCDWGYNPHQGLRITGKPVMTILRGSIITEGETFKGQRGGGEFLPRGPISKV